MRFRFLVLCILLAAPTAQAEKARVLYCPPNLDYCFYKEKPIEPRMRFDDAKAAIENALRCINSIPYSPGSPAWLSASDRCNRTLPP